jgi:hypothetical protein
MEDEETTLDSLSDESIESPIDCGNYERENEMDAM